MWLLLCFGVAIYTDFHTGPMRMRMLRDAFQPLDELGIDAVFLNKRRTNGCFVITANTDVKCSTGFGYSMTRACEDACARIVISQLVEKNA